MAVQASTSCSCCGRASQAGSLTVLIDRLPGFPDGIKPAAGGGFWVAMPTTRTKLFDMLENKLVRDGNTGAGVDPWLLQLLLPQRDPAGKSSVPEWTRLPMPCACCLPGPQVRTIAAWAPIAPPTEHWGAAFLVRPFHQHSACSHGISCASKTGLSLPWGHTLLPLVPTPLAPRVYVLASPSLASMPLQAQNPSSVTYLQVSETGQVLHYLNDPDGSHVAFVTSVSEAAAPGASGGKRRLFLGNIAQNYVSYVDVGASARRTV